MSGAPGAAFARHHAVVTGGGRGIGAAIAEALARLGAAVSLVGRTASALEAEAERLARAHGARVATATADVASEAEVRAAFWSLASRLGPPTILVNNAGMARSAPFLETGAGFWRETIDVDLMGAVHCTRAALPAMLEAGWGRIVNVASTAGLAGYAYITAYCAAKHALVGLTRALAMETARTGVTVNAVCPGYTDTEMVASQVEALVKRTGRPADEIEASFVAHNPQRRLVRPQEVSDAVVWLCGDDASAITGQSIAIAGGEIQ